MRIAHISDLHVSRMGTMLSRGRLPWRDASGDDWESLVDLAEGWRIDVHRADDSRFRWRDRVRLVDGLDLVYETLKITRSLGEEQAVEQLTEQRESLVRGSAAALAADLPDAETLARWWAADPANTNYRFLLVVNQLIEEEPDHVVITGDLTDDGVGYELIAAAMRPFVEADRLSVVPGNHDLYAVPGVVLPKALRRTEVEKHRAWGAFASSIGVCPGAPYLRDLGDGVMLAGLDSCHPAAIPGSASGLVPVEALHRVLGAFEALQPRVRIAALHHHVANPPTDVTGTPPTQAGMRLRNARAVHELLVEGHFDVVLNGHRHLGYRFHPVGSPRYVSAPSTTVGCRSGAEPYYWELDISSDDIDVYPRKVRALAGG